MAAKKRTTKKAARKKAAKRSPKKAARATGRKRSGQKPFVPTAEQRNLVKTLAGFGMPEEDIAQLVINPNTGKGISSKTLWKHFPEERAAGRGAVQAKLIDSLFQRATSTDHPHGHVCAMFILKCRFGWRQAERVEHVHEVGGQGGVLVAPAGVDPQEWIKGQKAKNAKRNAPSDDDA